MIINPIKKRRKEKGAKPSGLGSPGGGFSDVYFSF